MNDKVRAAAERLLTPVAPPIDPYQTTADILLVARAVLARDDERERLRAALKAAGIDLIGFEGYFERIRSMGTVQSIRVTLAKIEAALSAPPSGGDGAGEAGS